jgi:hypothetical protein
MKWFTDEWYQGDLNDAECAAVEEDYKQHLLEIREALPPGLRQLAEAGGPVSLHDGYFIATTARASGPDLQLDIATGPRTDQGQALVHVHLVYRDYELVEPSAEQLFWRARDPKLEILSGEVDVLSDGRFEHRLSTWPERVLVVIRFQSVDVAVVRFFNGTAETLYPAAPS